MPSATFDEGLVLRALGKNLADPSKAAYMLGLELASRAKRAFIDQSRGPYKWAPRATPNVPGILADLSRGSNPPNRRFEPRPAGIDTGRLLADIGSARAVRPNGVGAVDVGSRLPYAPLIQFGGDVDIPIDSSLKEKIAAYLKRMAGSAKRQTKKAFGPSATASWSGYATAAKATNRADTLRRVLGPLLAKNVTGITWRVSPRPFIVATDEDLEDFRQMALKSMFA